VLALIAISAGKTMSQNAAFEIAAKSALDIGGRGFIEMLRRVFQPGFEMSLNRAIPQRPLGTAALI